MKYPVMHYMHSHRSSSIPRRLGLESTNLESTPWKEMIANIIYVFEVVRKFAKDNGLAVPSTNFEAQNLKKDNRKEYEKYEKKLRTIIASKISHIFLEVSPTC